MDFFQILAFLAGAMIVVSTLPQVFKTLKLKEVKDLSLPMFILLGTAQILWIIYAIHINDLPVLLTNLLSAGVVFANIFLIFKYQRNG